MSDRKALDGRLRAALRSDGERVSFDPERWRPIGTATPRPQRPGPIAVAAALLLVGGVVVPMAALSLLRDTDEGASRPVGTPNDDPRTWESCRDEPLAAHVVSPADGRAGTQIEIHGALDTGWEREPEVEEFQVWWNLDRGAWQTAQEGHPQPAVEGQPVLQLERRFLSYSGPFRGTFCHYQVIVRTPEVREGTYPIVVLYAGHEEPPRWEALAPAEFTVTGRCPADPGPWADPDCPEAAWMLRVIEEAGYRATGRTSRAILVEQPDDDRFAPWEVHVQVMSVDDANRQGLDPSADATYTREQSLDGTVVWSDEDYTVFSWDRETIRVFVMAGPSGASFPPEAAYGLVSASGRVPPPP